jgi:hypothetical protein
MKDQIKQAKKETAERIITHAKRRIWCDFNDVNYFFVVSIGIFHNDHDIDYDDLIDFLDNYPIKAKTGCEDQSDLLYVYIAMEYPSRDVTVQVSKDANADRGSYIEYGTTKPLQSLSI